MTYLQLINAVLRRLREDTVTSIDQSDYAALIGDFVNEAKREVEDAWNWIQLRQTIQVATVADTYRYTLTGAGNRFRVLQVVNDTDDTILKKGPYKYMNQLFTTSGTTQTGSPWLYDINGNTNGDPNVDLYAIPDAVYTINFNLIIPQDDFTADGETLTVPSWPVILGAYMKAISERGEDGGRSYAEVANDYQKALSDAIAIDAGNVPDELIWEVN